MTSHTTPAAHPPAPAFPVREPGELIAALPYLIGFHPRDSLVVLAFGGPSGRRVGLTQRIDLPPDADAGAVCTVLADNLRRTGSASAAVAVLGGGPPGADTPVGGPAPRRRELAAAAAAALAERGVRVLVCAWAAGTAAGADWACYDECGCRGALPDVGATPLAAAAVAAGMVVHDDRAALDRLVAPGPAAVLRRRERLLTRAIDAAARGEVPDRTTAEAVLDEALADTAAGCLRLDDGRVLALALALSDPLVRDAALVRSAEPGAESAEHLWAALSRETPDPEAAEPAALLAACALLRGDGALAGIALDRAERAWPGHRLTGLLRAAWAAGMRPEQVRECLRTTPLPPAARARRRRGRRR